MPNKADFEYEGTTMSTWARGFRVLSYGILDANHQGGYYAPTLISVERQMPC